MNVPFMEERQNNSCNLELGSNPPPLPSFPLFASFTPVRRANNLAMGEMDLTLIFLGSKRIHMDPCLKYACSETLKRLPTPKLTCHSRFGANLKSASSAHRGGTKSDRIRLHPPRFVLGAPISSPALPFRLSQVTMSQPTGERDLKLGGERGRIGYASARY